MDPCIVVILGFVALFAFVTIRWRARTRRIAASRVGENFDTFHSLLAPTVPQEVSRAVYLKFQQWWSGTVHEFPVRAEDTIADVYGMVDEDLDDAVQEVLSECGRRLPPKDQLRQMRPVVTVRDFVSFVAACPKVG
jgi:hypothetical protein